MLLGFISLMLGVFQGATQKICVKESVMRHLLPCSLPSASAGSQVHRRKETPVWRRRRR